MSNRITRAIAGFIVVAILVALVFSVGLFSRPSEEDHYLTIPLVSLASGIVVALYFYTPYPLYARGRRLAIYFIIFFCCPALILPVIIDPEGYICTYDLIFP